MFFDTLRGWGFSLCFFVLITMTERYQRYNQYLQSDHWSALRQLKFSLSGRRCQVCSVMSGLDVHHIRYKNLTDCAPCDLLVLCRECHDILHLVIKRKRLSVEQQELSQVADLVLSYKSTPNYLDRKTRIKEKAARRQSELISKPPIHRLLKSEKKAIKKALQKCFQSENKVDGMKTVIDLLQTLIDKRVNQ